MLKSPRGRPPGKRSKPLERITELRRRKSENSVSINQRIGGTIAKQDSSTQEQPHNHPISPTKLKVTDQVGNEVTNEAVCLRWKNHHNNMLTSFPYLLKKEQFVDVTLIADGKMLKCHKVILSSCSSYFESILENIERHQHPVIFMRGIPFWVLKSLTDFMYIGEVKILQDQLKELLDVAQLLKIKGLAEKKTEHKTEPLQLKPEKEKPKSTEGTSSVRAGPAPVSSTSLLKPLLSKRVEEEQKTSVDPPVKPAVVPPKKIHIKVPLHLMNRLDQNKPLPEPQILAVTKQKECPKVYSKKNMNKRKGSDIDEASLKSSKPWRLETEPEPQPNTKVPKYYHNFFYSNNEETDRLSNTPRIKTEPVDPDFDPMESQVEPLSNILCPENDHQGVLITGIEEDRLVPVPRSRERTETSNNHLKHDQQNKEKKLDSSSNLQDACKSKKKQKRNKQVSEVEGKPQETSLEKERAENEGRVGDSQIPEIKSLKLENLEEMDENVADLVNEEEKEDEKNREEDNMDHDPYTEDKDKTSGMNEEEIQNQ